MKKIFVTVFSFMLLVGCAQDFDREVEIDSNDDAMIETDSEFEMVDEGEEFGYVEKDGQEILQGYVTLSGTGRTVTFDSDTYYKQPMDPFEYVFFDINESSSDLFVDEILIRKAGDTHVNVDEMITSVGIGCLEDGQIKFRNHTLGMDHSAGVFAQKYLSEELTTEIMSGEETEIEVYYEENLYDGTSVPFCFSHVVVQE